VAISALMASAVAGLLAPLSDGEVPPGAGPAAVRVAGEAAGLPVGEGLPRVSVGGPGMFLLVLPPRLHEKSDAVWEVLRAYLFESVAARRRAGGAELHRGRPRAPDDDIRGETSAPNAAVSAEPCNGAGMTKNNEPDEPDVSITNRKAFQQTSQTARGHETPFGRRSWRRS
jgi:hypothetical protein